MKREIRIKQPSPQTVDELSRSLNITPVTAALLVNRGITTLKAARAFLKDSLPDITPPSVLKDIDTAVRRITDAIVKKEKVLVFGDYDADGITATALMVDFLRAAGADVSYYIPHRIMEGYGLKADLVTSGAIRPDTGLIITVDCGSSNLEAALACRRAGIDLVVTDHHRIAPPFPDALAVVNPSREDNSGGLTMLAGVGVAFYLVIALRSFLREQGFWKGSAEPNLKQYCDLVAVGTVADIVPLVGENRVFTKAGLELINGQPRPGIQALLEAAKIKKRPLVAEDIAYVIAPRINAAGRIDHGKVALELLMATDADQAKKMADILNRLNTKRQLFEEDVADEIERAITADPALLRGKKSLVLAHRQWHPGIIGIVASRAVRKYHLPVALIAINGEMGVGSSRSIPGINLYDTMAQCADLFEDFGGHARAAGFKIRSANIPRFEKQFEFIIQRNSRPEDFVPVMEVDGILPLDRITEQQLREIESLQPFGEQNPEPLFLAENVAVNSSFMINGRHRKMTLCQRQGNSGSTVNAMRFNIPEDQQETGHFRRVVFRARRDTWNGRNAPQIIIEHAEITG
ncbi:MAG: single-stranded-DNA-specific exonuclease RecJ [Thermodesulfobacteriota bacterium]